MQKRERTNDVVKLSNKETLDFGQCQKDENDC